MRPSYRYMSMRGLGDVNCDDPSYTDEQSSACWAANEPDGTVDTGDESGDWPAPAAAPGTDFWGSLAGDFGALTGLDSHANTGGTDYQSQQQMAAGGLPGTPPPVAGSAPGVPGSGFFNPNSCATSFCFNDLLDTSQPYLYVGVAVLGLALLGGRK